MTPTKKNGSEATDLRPAGVRRLTYEEYAAERRISVDTVKRMARRGELEVERFSRKCVRIIVAAK
jgi:DNA-directed RNA polymerase specialized sigma24 family protein